MSHKRHLKKIKPSFHFHLNTSGNGSLISKKNNKTNSNKFLSPIIIRGKSFLNNSIFGDKYNLSKRINEKGSFYNLSQWKKDFKRSRIYKKISCEYPSINFVKKPKRKFNNNYAFCPKNDINMFSGVRFKPFESFEEDDSKGSNNNSKNKKKKRNFMFLHKNK